MTQPRGEGSGRPGSLDPTAPLNRAERRARRFEHHHSEAQTSPDALARADPSAGSTVDDAAHAGRRYEDVTHEIGPRTDGAAESEGRRPHHQGMHPGNPPNG